MAGSPSFDTTVIERPRGLPRWVLWALLPVALSLGVVTGVGMATYRSVQVPMPAPVNESPQGATPSDSEGAQSGETTPAPPTGSETNSLAAVGLEASWEIPGSRSSSLREPILPEPGRTDPPGLPGNVTPDPGRPTSSLPILQARSLLTERFGLMPAGDGLPIGFSYQVMRGNHDGPLLVGLLNAADYRRWEQAVLEDEAAVRTWLESAAEAARPLAEQEGFHLVWAIVDNVRRSPYDSFAQHEVTPMEDRTFLVMRPLAATATTALDTVVLRSVSTVWLDPGSSVEPWHVYRPVLRFDGSDIYRPSSANPWR